MNESNSPRPEAIEAIRALLKEVECDLSERWAGRKVWSDVYIRDIRTLLAALDAVRQQLAVEAGDARSTREASMRWQKRAEAAEAKVAEAEVEIARIMDGHHKLAAITQNEAEKHAALTTALAALPRYRLTISVSDDLTTEGAGIVPDERGTLVKADDLAALLGKEGV